MHAIGIVQTLLALSLPLLLAHEASAQSTCAVPVESYITSITGEPLDGTLDVELNFYLSGDAAAAAVDCRHIPDVGVSDGWMRIVLDACALPPDDGSGCGTTTLEALFVASDTTGDTVHVGIRVGDDPDELTPRVAIGAVPFAVRAGDAATLGGIAPDEFLRVGDSVDAATLGGIAPDEFLRVGELDCDDGEVLTYTAASGWHCAAAAGSGPTPGTGTIMYGNYNISNSVDLAGLVGFTEVTGNLTISAGDLPNLDGLESLTSVGNLEVGECNAITDLSGLSGLTTVRELLRIRDNSALSGLHGFEQLTTVGALYIHDNASLLNLTGLERVTTTGLVLIENNSSLATLDGFGLVTGSSLEIKDNESLIDVDGLTHLTTLSSDLIIRDNFALTTLHGLTNLASVGDVLRIENNDLLTSLDGLEGLLSIGERLEITYNDGLTRLDGLSGLVSVGDDFNMYANSVLCRSLIDTLLAGITVGGSLNISGNDDSC